MKIDCLRGSRTNAIETKWVKSEVYDLESQIPGTTLFYDLVLSKSN